MNNQKKTWLRAYHYIDAFAGSGKALAKDAERYIVGSPVRALQCEPPFDGYWFIERLLTSQLWCKRKTGSRSA
jgi:three-Cys-motif partner protein